MANLLQAARDQAALLTREAYERSGGVLPAGAGGNAAVEPLRDASRGDLASSFALAGAGAMGMAPRRIAQAVMDGLELEGSWFRRAEIAGPGFINFTLAPRWYGAVLCAVEDEGAGYGSSREGAGRTALVEFAPSCPPGLDDLRGAALGDTLANILSRTGWDVRRECCVSGAGDGACLALRDALRSCRIEYDQWRTAPPADGPELRDGGACTGFAAEPARHRGSLDRRGFHRVIRVQGADRLQSAPDGLRPDGSGRLAVVAVGRVNLLRDGQPAPVPAGGDALRLPADEAGADAARYFLNDRAAAAPLDLDLDLAARRDGGSPAYRVRYAHARCCAITANLARDGADVPAAGDVDPALLRSGEERALVRTLARYPEELRLAAGSCDPSRINRYLAALAGDFRRFCAACPVRGGGPALQSARLKLIDCTRQVLANGLGLLGAAAPVRI